MAKYLYAFDLSMECTGLVIFDIDTFKHVLITSIKTNPNKTDGERLHHIRSEIARIGKPYLPHDVALERGFSKHHEATQVLFRVHGVVNELFHNYPQTYYPPTSVKLAVTNDGSATKQKVQDVIEENEDQVTFANDDESDAYAVGVIHLIKKYGMKWKKPPRPIKKKKPRKPRTKLVL